MALRSTSLSSPIVPNWVRSSSGCGTDDCGRTSGPLRPSTMPSPPSTRPSGARGRRSFVFVREDGETATDSALLVDHHHRLNRRDQFTTMVVDESRQILDVDTRGPERHTLSRAEVRPTVAKRPAWDDIPFFFIEAPPGMSS